MNEGYGPEAWWRHPWVERIARFLGTVALIVIVAILGHRAALYLADVASGGVVTGPESGIPVDFTVAPGSSARTIGQDLADAGVVGSSAEFEREVRERGVAAQLKAGEYALETGMGAAAVVDILVIGPPPKPTYRVTVIEGLDITAILDSLAEQTPYTAQQLAAPLLDGSVSSPFHQGDPDDLVSWEGLLFPDTYEFVEDAAPATIVGRLATTMVDRMEAVDFMRLEDLGVTEYEAIIVASLIEREVRLDEERPLVASVIYNRLDLGMALQIDASVVYALGGDVDGGLTLDDLEIDSPYNTYRFPGLPPTPIGAPRLASLEAAADPVDSDYLYYVLTAADGSHSFTASYDEFLQWKQEAKDAGVIP